MMNKKTTLLEAIAMGGDVYDLLGVNRETKLLKKRATVTIQATIEVEKEEIVSIAEVVDITPLNKPSDRFDIDDYERYREYVLENGGQPSLRDYFKAVEYYKSRA